MYIRAQAVWYTQRGGKKSNKTHSGAERLYRYNMCIILGMYRYVGNRSKKTFIGTNRPTRTAFFFNTHAHTRFAIFFFPPATRRRAWRVLLHARPCDRAHPSVCMYTNLYYYVWHELRGTCARSIRPIKIIDTLYYFVWNYKI